MATFIHRALAVIVFAMPLAANAGTWLTVPIASYHFSERTDGKGSYEQLNAGLGLEYALNEKFRIAAGLYRNSVRTDSGYFGIAYLPFQYSDFRLGTSVGVVSGYNTNLLPVLVPTLTWEGKSFGANVMLVPPYDGKPGGLGFVLKWRLP